MQEFLTQLDTKKAVVVSLNLVHKDLAARCPMSDELGWLGGRLEALNGRWDRCCARAALWQKELQIALLQSAVFTNSLKDLNTWLNETERTISQHRRLLTAGSDAEASEARHKFKVRKQRDVQFLSIHCEFCAG